ncbi:MULTISPECIES: hypothetical protein [Pseudoalteromonas]|uniref:hypothetical protein n=1 Tax=Pseudoalteromonas TaxID=53246 RepID=UPI000C09CBD1|nr:MULTISPECIES: hypothetical protein [Pseudoalteromonas]MAC34716.1 hypothetical protein [Haliea sp.]MCF6459090.1 XRE family transcriptional regulator [Pseudoalteromonas sp. MMG024]MDI4653105.1 XRE family transcriptional regulator [Pseudoalteromonas shioyasakiensis]NUJ39191.1 hypothetical protein [Pseudoalteromonas sp. 0303]
MNRTEFKAEYEKRGWTPLLLAKRWGCSKTRIHQMAAEVEQGHKKAQAYIDMLHGLPHVINS